MGRILKFKTDPGHYRADFCLVSCFDKRFYKLTDELISQFFSGLSFDLVRIAGGAKWLASDDEVKRNFLLDEIKTSCRLHGTKKVVLTLHLDCGAYGGSAAFQGDSEKEIEHHRAALKRAAALVSETLPGVGVECFLLGFEGASEVIWNQITESDDKTEEENDRFSALSIA